MDKNRLIQIIMKYGDEFDPEQDISYADAAEIIKASQTKMELVENSYLYGHMRGLHDHNSLRQVPLYDIPQMTDEEWNRLAAQNKRERQVAV